LDDNVLVDKLLLF
jgi:hypothetical protein